MTELERNLELITFARALDVWKFEGSDGARACSLAICECTCEWSGAANRQHESFMMVTESGCNLHRDSYGTESNVGRIVVSVFQTTECFQLH